MESLRDPAAVRRCLRLYAVLNVEYGNGRVVCACAAAIVDAGVTLIQLRDKQGSDEEVVALAQQLRAIIQPRPIPLLLNDRWHLVAAAGADGVHLGQDDGDLATVRQAVGEGAIIGRSIDQPQDVQPGHDYLGIGPLFPTTSKGDAGPVVGLQRLRQWRPMIGEPLVAIGGISMHNAASAIAAGADGVAVISALTAAADPGQACRSLASAISDGFQQRENP